MASAPLSPWTLCLLLGGSFRAPSSLPLVCFAPTCLRRFRALKTRPRCGKGETRDGYTANLLGKPTISPLVKDLADVFEPEGIDGKERYEQRKGNEWVDWEDRMLEDTVPLVASVKMILHSRTYRSGDRLSFQHERIILERLLPYHPESEKKIGSGIDYITVGYHPDFEVSRCLFIVRKDGELVDFSYWKCIKGLIKENYPLYADSFLFKYFQQHKRDGSR